MICDPSDVSALVGRTLDDELGFPSRSAPEYVNGARVTAVGRRFSRDGLREPLAHLLDPDYGSVAAPL